MMEGFGGHEEDLGVPPSGSGSRPSDGAACSVSPAVAASIPNAVREVIEEANNSLYGSQGFFLSTCGGEADKYHLARPIERLKEDARREWRRAEIYEVTLRAMVELGYLHADKMDFARMAQGALASAIEAASADETRSGSAEGESAAPQSGETPK